MTDVKGKWALITGASRGIGRLIAFFMAERGCNLVLHSRSAEHTKELCEEIKKLGVDARAVSCELSDLDAVKKMLAEIDGFGVDIDFVFNNAGLQIAYREDYYKTPVEDFTGSFSINTIAPAIICYHYLPKMIEKGFGRVINTTSGIVNQPEQAGYSASKVALNKVSIDLGLRLEGTDVMINLVDPGWCRTALGGPHAPNTPESALPGVVLGAFLDDKVSGRIIDAQAYAGMSLEDAIAKITK